MNKKLAMVFPGPGSQAVGMLDDMAAKFPVIKETFAQASKILGYDAWKLVTRGPMIKLDETQFTQSVMLAADVAIWRVWLELHGQKPEMLAGHSLGEYSALVCAQSLTFEDAVSLVALRGSYMQNAVPLGQGTMAAIVGLNDEAIYQLCADAAQGEILAPANFNSIGQVVIAGATGAVHRAVDMAKEKRVKVASVLPITVPSHCPMMQPAADQMAEALSKVTIAPPQIPVIHNFDVKNHNDPEEIRSVLVKQMVSPVRWVETVREMGKMGVTDIIECGPGRSLFGMINWITRSITPHSINDPELIAETVKLFPEVK